MYQRNQAPEATKESDIFPEWCERNDTILQRVHIENASLKAQVVGNALVQRSEVRTDRGGRPYVAMTLQCAGGATVEARWWHFPHTPDDCPVQGTIYRITASVDVFNGERQLRVISAEHMPLADLRAFIRSTRRSVADLLHELDAVYASLDEPMRALVQTVLRGQILEDFCEWPAAQRHHGAVRHGLLAHSLRVAELVQRMADAYGIDGLDYDCSLAVAAALLHDIGKLRTLPAVAGAAIPGDAHLYDHVTLSILTVQSAAHELDNPLPSERLDSLLHAILAHHGRQEWGAAREPHTVEAWLVHLADLAESRLWAFSHEESEVSDHLIAPQVTGTVDLQDALLASNIQI